jgi:hypothetical protein
LVWSVGVGDQKNKLGTEGEGKSRRRGEAEGTVVVERQRVVRGFIAREIF